MLWLFRKAYHNCVVHYKTQMHSFLEERRSFGETRKSCTQFKEFDSLILRYVTRVSETRKVHRLEEYKSNLDISEVSTLQNSRIGPTKRLKDKSGVPKARLWNLAKNINKLKENDKATFFSFAKWVLPCASARESVERERESLQLIQERVCIWSVRKTFNSAELQTMRTSRSPTMANGEVRTNKEATIYVKQLDLFVKVMLLE